MLIALLTSPHFIYKAESPELTDVERAHRLSYFLWNTVPDAELLDAAKSGALVEDPSAQVERMLEDAKAGRFVDDFTRQWLQLDIAFDQDASVCTQSHGGANLLLSLLRPHGDSDDFSHYAFFFQANRLFNGNFTKRIDGHFCVGNVDTCTVRLRTYFYVVIDNALDCYKYFHGLPIRYS